MPYESNGLLHTASVGLGGDFLNNKKQILTIILSVLITLSVVLVVWFGVKRYQDTVGFTKNDVQDVTMIQLIATPEKYDGRIVRVIGVGNLEFEGNCISLSKEDWKYGVGNSIWIEFGKNAVSYEEAQAYNGEYVIVEGLFDKDDCGHEDMFCGSIKNIYRYDLWRAQKSDHLLDMYSVTKDGNFTYTYTVVDKNGQVLFSKNNATRQPTVEQISPCVLGLKVQTGTGLSTNWAVYCDVENSKVSETFHYVLGAQGDYVVYGDYEEGKLFVVVQNIFDKSVYYKTYELENVSPVAANALLCCEFDKDNHAIITYLTGEEYTKTERTIPLP